MADTVPPCISGPKPKKRRVYVFGAGIAGMTAAHELALRGFEVHVYERDKALDARGNHSLAIGGLARTQYFQPPTQGTISFNFIKGQSQEASESAGARIHPNTATSVSLGLDQARPFSSLWLEFQDEPAEEYEPKLTQRACNDLNSALEKLTSQSIKELGRFRILIQPFYDQSLNEIEDVSVTRTADASSACRNELARAKKRAQIIKERVKAQPLLKSIKVKRQEPLPANTELGQPPTARNWVRVLLERVILPGEHGYRYFPSYYRHVFDTMRRIPIYDDNGLPTSRTTYDNLVALPTIGIASEKHPPFITNWGPYSFPTSFSREARDLRNLMDLGITSQDLLQFSLRILRYMLTSPQRRAADLENLSWWQYIEGHDPKTGRNLYCYSKAFTDLVKSSGRVLVALDGKSADARTMGNTYVQLLTDVIVPTQETHATLNGPTSAAWFSHWHTHLRQLGVQFRQGQLTGFEQAAPSPTGNTHYKPTVQLPSGESIPVGDPDAYYVVAVDVLAAEEITRSLQPMGVAFELQGYTTLASAKAGEPGTIQRDPTRKPGMFHWDRLQTLSGIQYFFTTEFNLIDGYLYLVDAPWGISAICSPIAWQHQPIQGLSHYQSLLSVDIGDWNKSSPNIGMKAWECTPAELAEEVFRQIRKALQRKEHLRPSLDFNPPEPAFVHIDEGIVFDVDDPHKAHIRYNKTPFLLPTVADWIHRPGVEALPWDPTPGAPRYAWTVPKLDPSRILWGAEHGGYYVHWNQIVFAGTYTPTFTRLTTMESANESARHAVNAILDHCSMRESESPPEPLPPQPQVYEPLFPTTPMGDYCRIWNPEANELPDLMALRDKDADNFKMGLPHSWDLLGIEVLPSMLSHLSAASPASATSTDAFSQVESLLRGLGMHSGHGGGEGLVGLLRRIRTQLEESLRHGAAGYRPPTS
ncbi:hypothetical protein COCOR_06215 [Corallococcus coralloides DSM 2259]|uniref:Uncharacterized protein n=1 Tax=Corallococcus coralloides (strain ATCC 25202 / DSM 2259 / NBRC 100086 / M2) TaxID=1144275 RepID=H8MNT4_CORCM|nr:NAD(P)-binding protein [Corallococcus coralloides]AFE06814.1 hypothetical protein COCOR_06215 [Corallococcus coralloides DSM 2259]